MKLDILEGLYSIHKLPHDSQIPPAVLGCNFFNISRTLDELSIVAPQTISIKSDNANPDWVCIKIIGPLELNLTGILSEISDILEKAGVSLFAISTYETDYFLVKQADLKKATKALIDGGHTFVK